MIGDIKIIDEIKHFDEASAKILSIISHEIRGSFNIINGISNLILRDNIIKDPDVRELILLIQSTSTKSFDLLDKLLQLSNLDSDIFITDKKNISINNIIKEIIEFYKFQINQKKLSIILDLDNNAEIRINESMMIFIIRNLLSNAIKFSNINGKIEISYKWKNNFFELSVKDYGIGMNRKKIEEINENIYQVSFDGTIGEKGSGMGLNLCRHFIKQYNGNLEIESSLGKGSNIIVTLPV
ncbi:MAG: HAMP domain-containing histidine kinase [Ignavibacteriae bacterium]|nr:HAMP domain-containing histidine kinase [Ignavibacteriota bacterium]